MDLRDRVALVTGGDRGIGRAIALALADRGAHVAVSFRSRASEAAAAVEELRARGRRAAAVLADLALEGEVEGMVAAAVEAVGPIDLFVSNAGVGAAAGLDALDAALFDRTLAVNLRAAFLATRAVLPGMRSRRFGRLLYVHPRRRSRHDEPGRGVTTSRIWSAARKRAARSHPSGIAAVCWS